MTIYRFSSDWIKIVRDLKHISQMSMYLHYYPETENVVLRIKQPGVGTVFYRFGPNLDTWFSINNPMSVSWILSESFISEVRHLNVADFDQMPLTVDDNNVPYLGLTPFDSGLTPFSSQLIPGNAYNPVGIIRACYDQEPLSVHEDSSLLHSLISSLNKGRIYTTNNKNNAFIVSKDRRVFVPLDINTEYSSCIENTHYSNTVLRFLSDKSQPIEIFYIDAELNDRFSNRNNVFRYSTFMRIRRRTIPYKIYYFSSYSPSSAYICDELIKKANITSEVMRDIKEGQLPYAFKTLSTDDGIKNISSFRIEWSLVDEDAYSSLLKPLVSTFNKITLIDIGANSYERFNVQYSNHCLMIIDEKFVGVISLPRMYP